ncbi:MAG: glycosyltransferase [Chrysiogenia bacterium]
MNRLPPRVSVMIAAYQSQQTIAGTLAALRRQTFKDFETIVVDSSPHEKVAAIVRRDFQEVVFEHSPQRLLPHAARNRGAALAQGALFVFSDPDVYPVPEWLELLCQRHDKEKGPVVGSIICHGRRWIDIGAHFVKFDQWLPVRGRTSTDLAPTANFLCPKEAYEQAGGLPADIMLGDAVFSWRLMERGYRLVFCPEAVVEHHHLGTLRDNLRERWRRGYEYAGLRAEMKWRWRGRLRMALTLFILPLRLLKQTARSGENAWRCGSFFDFLWVLPLVLAGHGSWLLGESRYQFQRLFRFRPLK